MIRLKKKPLAVEDEEQHFLHLAAENLDAAVRWLDVLEAGYRQILAHPDSGAPRAIIDRPDYRDVRLCVMGPPFQRWQIYYQYRATDQVVEIIRVLHSAQDQPDHLSTS